MASLILNRLKQKPVPIKDEPVKILIPKAAIAETVEIKAKIVDKTQEPNYERDMFLSKLRERGLIAPEVGEKEVGVPEVGEKEAVATEEPAVATEEPAVATEEPAIATEEPAVATEEPAVATEEPAVATEEPAVATEEPPIKIKIAKKPRLKVAEGTITQQPDAPPKKTTISTKTGDTVPVLSIKIGDEFINDRLPKQPLPIIRASTYYLNNREIFTNFINTLFSEHSKDLAIMSEKEEISCESKTDQFSLLTHQKIVRDYMNSYSPYRGIVLYHGLGSGKTCSSIAIAEGMKTSKQVIIMTPASLRANYNDELKKCGDLLYKRNQFWEFVPTKKNPAHAEVLSQILSLDPDFIKKIGGAWLVNVKKPSNYEQLTSDQRASLEVQLNQMIAVKYQFINYNGLRSEHLRRMSNDGTTNPFDNKVIIIDEAHNFVSRIVNKLGRKGPKSLSIRMYEYLMAATNCRLIFLSGTPIINYPNEIAVLYNMLRGYIKTFSISLDVQTSRKIDTGQIKKILNSVDTLDYMDYKPTSKTLIVTRNPLGFINSKDKDTGEYNGVRLDDRGNIDDDKFLKMIVIKLKDEGIETKMDAIKITLNTALPDRLDDFQEMFIDARDKSLKNDGVLKRRLVGLTSYFRSAQEQLMPKFDATRDIEIVHIPMSDYQFGIYEQARATERKMESQNSKKKKAPGSSDLYSETVSTYRIFSRAFCNFVFPREIPRPMPKEGESVETALNGNVDEDVLDATTVEERVENVDGRYSSEDKDKIKETMAEVIDKSYGDRIIEAMRKLRERGEDFLSMEALETYGPKMRSIIERIKSPDNKGLHLVYSQFRTLEGIGVLSAALEANGHARFKIKKDASDEWVLDIAPEDIGKPKYAFYTGTETQEEKDIVKAIFNSLWDNVPNKLATQIREMSPNNFYGEIIKTIMITAAGAEGISLRNVRFVHLMEPYWHPVRPKQVIGRARRICSHHDLPELDRTVKVFLYLMKFSEKQLSDTASIELRLKDRSKIDPEKTLSSDEALYEISNIKESINEKLLVAVKETSIDCIVYQKQNVKEGIKCYGFNTRNSEKYAYVPDYSKEDKDQVANINKKVETWKGVKVTINGRDYAMRPNVDDPRTGILYDLESYKEFQKNPSYLLKFEGYLRRNEKTGEKYIDLNV
jgi:hypothetical protein